MAYKAIRFTPTNEKDRILAEQIAEHFKLIRHTQQYKSCPEYLTLWCAFEYGTYDPYYFYSNTKPNSSWTFSLASSPTELAQQLSIVYPTKPLYKLSNDTNYKASTQGNQQTMQHRVTVVRKQKKLVDGIIYTTESNLTEATAVISPTLNIGLVILGTQVAKQIEKVPVDELALIVEALPNAV